MFENIIAKIKLRQLLRNYRIDKDISEAIDSICKEYELLEIEAATRHFLTYTFGNKDKPGTRIELTFWNANKYYAWMSSGSIILFSEDKHKKCIFSWIDAMPEAKTMLKIREMNKKIVKDTIVNGPID